MNWLEKSIAAFLLWVDAVARTLCAPLDWLRSSRYVEAIEESDGTFTVRLAQGAEQNRETLAPLRVQVVEGALDGVISEQWAAAFRRSRIELVLQSSRFLFRSLELPKRAVEFVDGIVRSQIDRLTPWNASDSCYHWTRPDDIAGDRIRLTIAATARSATMSFVRAFSELGAARVDVSTTAPGAETGRITVFKQQAGGNGELGRLRVALLAGFLGTGLLAAISVGAAEILGNRYEDEIQRMQARIAARRVLIRGNQAATGGSALELLEKRKQTTPSSVMVIEALSALLPDHTFATEVRIEGDKLQVVGITRDAPSLIGLLEQSPHFTGATFFAPTMRAPNDQGERFNVETKIRPYFRTGT